MLHAQRFVGQRAALCVALRFAFRVPRGSQLGTQVTRGLNGRKHLRRCADACDAPLDARQQLRGGLQPLRFAPELARLTQARLPPHQVPPVPRFLRSAGRTRQRPGVRQAQARPIEVSGIHQLFNQQQPQPHVFGLGADDVTQVRDRQLAVIGAALAAKQADQVFLGKHQYQRTDRQNDNAQQRAP